MRRFGLVPTKNSGAGWVEKEDGYNEDVLAQLKSTDAASVGLKLKDIQTLEYNAAVSHKLPVFMVQFLETGDIFFIARPHNFPALAQYIECGVYNPPTQHISVCDAEPTERKRPKVKSSVGSRDKFWEQRRKEYGDGKKAR